MARRVVLIMLLAFSVAGMVFAAGSQQSTAADTAGQRVDVEILIWWARRFAVDDALIARLGDHVNANVTIETIPHNVYYDQITTRIAANDLPVMYKVQIPNTTGFRMLYDLIEDGRLTPLEDITDRYGLANWQAYLDRPELNHLRQDDGNIYASPIWAGSNAAGLYTRMDWLNELGLSAPSTWAEFGETFRRVLAANPNGRLSAGFGGTGLPDQVIRGFTGGFGIGEIMEYEGVYTLGAMHPGAREAVRLIAQWYQEGLLHPTAIAGDSVGPTEVMRIITDGNIASTWHVGLPGHWRTIYDGLAANDPGFELGFLPTPAGPDGGRYFGGGHGYYGGLVLNSSYGADMQSRAAGVIDYLFSDAGTALMFDGIEGVHYTLQNGAKTPIAAARDRDFVGSVSNLIDLVDRSIAWEREANTILAANFYEKESIAVRPVVTGLATENFTELQQNVGEVISQFLPRFYTGELSVDRDWPQMLRAIESAGLQRMLGEVRAFKGM